MHSEEFVIVINNSMCAVYRNNKLFLEDEKINATGMYRLLYALGHKVKEINATNEIEKLVNEQGFPTHLAQLIEINNF